MVRRLKLERRWDLDHVEAVHSTSDPGYWIRTSPLLDRPSQAAPLRPLRHGRHSATPPHLVTPHAACASNIEPSVGLTASHLGKTAYAFFALKRVRGEHKPHGHASTQSERQNAGLQTSHVMTGTESQANEGVAEWCRCEDEGTTTDGAPVERRQKRKREKSLIVNDPGSRATSVHRPPPRLPPFPILSGASTLSTARPRPCVEPQQLVPRRLRLITAAC